MTAPARLLAPLLVLFLASCGATIPKKWVERDLEIRSETVLWQYALASLNANGFPVGLGADPTDRSIKSGYRNELQPFRGDGFRERAFLRFEPTDEGFQVRARVEREINQDIVKPLLAKYAKWERVQDNEAMAERLVQFIESRLGTTLELDSVDPPKVDDFDDVLGNR